MFVVHVWALNSSFQRNNDLICRHLFSVANLRERGRVSRACSEEAHTAAERASQSSHLKIAHINNILMLKEDVRGLAGFAFRWMGSAHPLVSR